MHNLIEELEAAEAGSRELDELLGQRFPKSETDDYGAPLINMDRGPVTQSLDAIIALIEETFEPSRCMVRRWLPRASYPYRVWIFRDARMPTMDRWPTPTPKGNSNSYGVSALHRDEVLAHCIALLRALQAGVRTDG